MRATARLILLGWRRFRFGLWIAQLRLKLRYAGGRLELEAPHGAILDGWPAIRVWALGDGAGVFRMRLGREVRFGHNVTFELGDNALIQDAVRIILRSGRISVGRNANIRDGVWLKSDGELILGDDIPVAQYSALHCAHRIVLEDYVGLAERVTVLDSDHSVDGSDTYFRDQPLRVGETVIGRNTFIAANAVVLRDARIGRNSLVAANSVVRGGLYPDSSIVAGSPAKVVRELADQAPEGERSQAITEPRV